MNLKKIRIELDTTEIQQLLGIALEDDSEQALTFIKRKLVKRLERALQPR